MSAADTTPGPEHPVCLKCGLFKAAQQPFWTGFYQDGEAWVEGLPTKSHPDGWVLVLGDGISQEMDEGEPFADEKVLKFLRTKGGLDGRLVYHPGICCRTPDGPDGRPRLLKKPEITRCFSHFIKARVAKLQELGLSGIIAAGPVASFTVAGSMAVKSLGGRRVGYVHDRSVPVWVTPDMESVIVQEAKRPQLIKALHQAASEILDGVTVETMSAAIEYDVAWSGAQIEAWMAQVPAGKNILYWDTETNSLDPFSASFRVGLFSFYCPGAAKPLIVAAPSYKLAWERFEAARPGDDFETVWRDELRPAIAAIMTDPAIRKIGHNQQFDELAVHADPEVAMEYDGFFADTMIWNYLIFPDEKRNSLDELVRRWHPSCPPYWEPLETYMQQHEVANYLELPWDVLVPYAAFDTQVLEPVFKALLAHLRQLDEEGYGGQWVRRQPDGSNLSETYSLLEYALHGRKVHQRLCTHLEKVGQHIDWEILPSIEKLYVEERNTHRQELDSHPDVHKFATEVLPNIASKTSLAAKLIKRGEIPRVNWGSQPQVKALIVDYLGLEVTRKTKTGGICLDETSLIQLSGKHPVCALLNKWRKADKFIGSFIDPVTSGRVVWADKRLHSRFKPSGTETSRLSTCVERGTLITTARGLVPIEQLVVGDRVLTHRMRYQEVSAVFCKGMLPAWEMKTRSHQLSCTGGHRLLLASGGWRSLASLVREGLLAQVVTQGGPERLVEAREVGLREIWDMTVVEDHSYFGNGLAGHNSAPNIQAVPREGLVKKIYRPHRDGGWVITRDYSGLEVRVITCAAHAEGLIDTFNSAGDPHFLTQQHFFGELADKRNKSQRSICKQALFGRIYGQTDMGLHELLLANDVRNPLTGDKITLEECEEFNRMLDQAYPELPLWSKKAHQFATQLCWVGTPFGFVRPLDSLKSYQQYADAKRALGRKAWESSRFRKLAAAISKGLRQAGNSPIQSSAGDITAFAAFWIIRRLKQAGLDSVLFNVVHDDIWVSCGSDEEVVPTVQIMAEVMDNSPDWLPELLPGYDPSWIEVPLVGECDVGLNPKDCFGVSQWPTFEFPDRRLTLRVPGAVAAAAQCAPAGSEDEAEVPFLGNEKLLREVLDAKRRQVS